jgi:hypothetical protein
MQVRRHVTPPTDDHQLRLIALAYNAADDVMYSASDEDDDDDDEECEDSSLSENDSPRLRLHHGSERHRMIYHYR